MFLINNYVLRRALDFVVESEGKREVEEDTEDTGGGRKLDGWCQLGRCALPI